MSSCKTCDGGTGFVCAFNATNPCMRHDGPELWHDGPHQWVHCPDCRTCPGCSPMAYALSDHPYQKVWGRYLRLGNGETWSLVDLATRWDGKEDVRDEDRARLYGEMGGHFEAALIRPDAPVSGRVDGDSIFRGRSFDHLVFLLASRHEEVHHHCDDLSPA